EKNDYIGGATTSQRVFPDFDAHLSRYAYLVSLLPQKIIRDLGLNLELRRRAIASCTPYVSHGQHGALVLSNLDEEVSRKSIVDLTGREIEFERMKNFYNLSRVFAEQVGTRCSSRSLRKTKWRAGLRTMKSPARHG